MLKDRTTKIKHMNMISLKIYKIKALTKKVILLCFFGAIILLTNSCTTSRNIASLEENNKEWKIVKIDKNDEPTWIIYTKKLVGTNFFEYKIEGDIEASPKVCVASFKQDIYNLANGTKKDGDFEFTTYEIVDESKDSLSTYAIHNEPFIFKDTEMSVRYIFFKNEDGSTGVRWNEAWDEYPVQPSKKLSRVETFRGSWYFSPTSNNSCKAVNSVQFNLRGMPLWLAEPMVLKFLKGGLEDIREMVL